MSEHMKCSASPIVCVWLTSIHSRLPAVPLRFARRQTEPTGDHQSVLHDFLGKVATRETRPLYLLPIE